MTLFEHPAIPFFLIAIVAPYVTKVWRQGLQLATPLFSAYLLWALAGGTGHDQILSEISFAGYQFHWIRLDKLSFLFTSCFLLFAFVAHLFSLHSDEKHTLMASNLYIGSSIGATLAGDMITLFIFWELMALFSCLLIYNPKNKKSLGALFRYLLFHLTGGLFFFTGLLLELQSLSRLPVIPLEFGLGAKLIFIGIAINAALVPFHAWLPDAYPSGTPTSSVYLSCFTTKVAVYAFARLFPGNEWLILLGVLAAFYGVIFALMENDMRKLLSYHIVCQIGYMVIGIGLGTGIGISAGTGHAVGNILFKGLLFMATGAIVHMAGTAKLNELGSIGKKNIWIVLYFMVGALAISGCPGLNGYVSKSILLEALHKEHRYGLEWALLIVAVGTFLSITCKLAYFAFWAQPQKRPRLEPIPWNMHAAMGLLALTCLFYGVFPKELYKLLPYHADFHAYTAAHVVHTLQLLLATWIGFVFMMPKLHAKAVLTLDVDWLYRKGSGLFIQWICTPLRLGQEWIQNCWSLAIEKVAIKISKLPPQTFVPTRHPLFIMVSACAVVGTCLLLLRNLS